MSTLILNDLRSPESRHDGWRKFGIVVATSMVAYFLMRAIVFLIAPGIFDALASAFALSLPVASWQQQWLLANSGTFAAIGAALLVSIATLAALRKRPA